MPKTGYQTSAGGIVLKKIRGEWKVPLLLREEGKVWALPKGLIEVGEPKEVTALREVKEETGLSAKILSSLGKVQYGYYSKWNDTRYHKTVYFYLMQATGGSIQNHDYEAEAVRWFRLEAAIQHLTFPAEKKIVKKAAALVKKWPSDH